uniref:Uncharacterized protein n=1 Tax=Bos indicus x Bos taurus TaxID=30522 RepID=A0A4W2C4G9_BOBOX
MGVVTWTRAHLAHRPRSGCRNRVWCSSPFAISVELSWHLLSSLPNIPAPPAPSKAPAAPFSDSGRRCRTARTVCRPRSRRQRNAAPRGRAGTRTCRNSSGSGSLGAGRGETRPDVPPGAGPGSEVMGGRAWARAAAWLLPWGFCPSHSPRPPGGPLALSRRGRSLPTPHSPAQVSVRTRTSESSRRRVRGPMTRILRVWGETESRRRRCG